MEFDKRGVRIMKYYAQKKGCSTLRKIITDSDEEAIKKAEELFGTENVIVGKTLQRMITPQERKKMNCIEEEVIGDMLGERAKEIIHIKNNL